MKNQFLVVTALLFFATLFAKAQPKALQLTELTKCTSVNCINTFADSIKYLEPVVKDYGGGKLFYYIEDTRNSFGCESGAEKDWIGINMQGNNVTDIIYRTISTSQFNSLEQAFKKLGFTKCDFFRDDTNGSMGCYYKSDQYPGWTLKSTIKDAVINDIKCVDYLHTLLKN